MKVYDVGMFNEAGNIIATYRGAAQSTAHAKVRCIQRAAKAGRVDVAEESALMSKAYGHSKCSAVNTDRWAFTCTAAEATPS